MSILDDGPLATHRAPRTVGDQLPGHPAYKDGVEEKWNRKEAKAIRGLAAGYAINQVAEACGIKRKTLRRWMGNPYFMMEVQKLADHNVFRYRAAVLGTVARRAIAGSAQHARLYLLVTKDLKDDPIVKTSPTHGMDKLDDMAPPQLDAELLSELEKLTEKPGGQNVRESRRRE